MDSGRLQIGGTLSAARVLIALPTYRRTGGLVALVGEVVRQVEDLDERTWDIEIAVVDNDPNASARRVLSTAIDQGIVRYVVEDSPGISAVRNRAMREASGASLLIMMDDDEYPAPGWLASLLTTWRRSGAAVVEGRVLHEFDGYVDPWVSKAPFFARRNLTTGTELREAYTSNILLDLDQIRLTGVQFEDAFGVSGGGDCAFTRDLHARGLRIVFCSESVVTELVPAERMTRRWVIRRALRGGITECRMRARSVDGTWGRVAVSAGAMLGGLVRAVVGSSRRLLGIVSRDIGANVSGTVVTYRGIGMVLGALGFDFVEYGDGRKGVVGARRPRLRSTHL